MTTLPQAAPIRTSRALPSTSLSVPGTSMGQSHGTPALQVTLTAGDIWRVIRGNLWLIAAVLLVATVGGYALNTWLAFKHSRFTSAGLLQVHTEAEKSILASGLSGSAVGGPDLEVEQNTQAAQLTHESLLATVLESSEALRQTEWFKQFEFLRNGQKLVDSEAAKTDLLDHLEVIPIPNSRLIRVRMSYRVPKDCQTIVTEIVNEHIKEQKVKVSQSDVDHISALDSLKQNYDGQIREIRAAQSSIAAELGKAGMSIGAGGSSKNYELTSLISEQLRAIAFMGAADAKLKTFNKQMETNSAPELEEALQRSGVYAEYRRQVDELQSAYGDLSSTLGPQHPRTLATKRRLDSVQQKLADTENDIKSRTAELLRANLENDRTAAEQALLRINKSVEDVRRVISDLAKKSNDYERLGSDLVNIQSQLDHVKEQQDRIAYLVKSNNWAPVEWATFPDLPDHPSFPRLVIILPLSIMVGLALSLGLAFLREMTDNTVRTPRDIARVGQLTLLGTIPHEDDDPQAAGARLPLAIFEAPHSMIAEQFRQVRTRLQHAASLDTTRSIMVTGCSADDGVTTIAVNLASGLALNGRRILLVDANFRRPSLQNIFQANSDLGFGDVLNDLDLFQDAVLETEVPNLSVVLAGAKPSNPTELLESQLLIDFIERALEEYDHVIFDSGPLLMVSDSIALAPRVDGVVTVVRARGNSRGMLGRMRDEIRRLKAEHLGVVLNAVRVHGGGYYGGMIRDYYAYQNG